MRKLGLPLLMVLATSNVYASESEERDISLSNFSYNYIGVNVGLSEKQISVRGSKTIHSNAHVSMDAETDMDDNYSLAVGLNFHAPITDWADITGGIKAVHKETDDSNFGWGFEIGYRQWLSTQLEVGGSLEWDYLDSSTVGGKVHANFHATKAFSFGATLGFEEIAGNLLMFTTRYEF
ncbi:hypothetical protein [Vibrio mediterranei]|uniref:hypothetical protein n=1 Tax=Vibrio mediterranei TaxID=689 RepID=UPI00406871D5